MPSRPISTNQKPSSILRSKSIFLVIIISAASLILFTILYFIFYLWYTLIHRSRTSPFDSSTPIKLKEFSYKELKSATNKFSLENAIGKGGSGTVFGGILREGKSVAVKKLDTSSLQAEREFQCELNVLGGIRSSPYVVPLLGYCVEKSKKILVYEYMPNRSLQELLFNDENLCVNWDLRFQIIQDVARAIEFLHTECDPPVIHGDIKPSNVLLDWDIRAKIADFGLSRLKVEGEFGVEIHSQELWKSQELSGNLNVQTSTVDTPTAETPTVEKSIEVSNEVDFALALQASSSSKNSWINHNFNSLKGKEVITEDTGVEEWKKNGLFDQEVTSIEHSKELDLNPTAVTDEAANSVQWGKDWWWQRDESGELCSKDYVREWIGSQICTSMNPDQVDKARTSVDPSSDKRVDLDELNECQLKDFDVEQKRNRGKNKHKNKAKNLQEWWKEEEIDEMSRKGSKRAKLKKKMKKTLKMPRFDLGRRFLILRRRKKEGDQNEENPSLEFSFRRGWKRKSTRARTRSMGSDMWSGDLFSRELSSTTSMRGTLCYVAPECGGCGEQLMEKGDIYSFGVLILVIVSGRRPLHVLNSPMQLEKANLVSWCRQLAQSGNVLEQVDERLKDAYNKEQATLCIHLALACLQRVPELRPNISDVVRVLIGKMELPPLPFEFSPSPPSKFYSRSRRNKTIS